jgi:putative transposase
MRKIKGRSARKLFEEFLELKKHYWGKHFWARGYFCVMAGKMPEEMIKNYFEHHFEANPNDHFKTKYGESK